MSASPESKSAPTTRAMRWRTAFSLRRNLRALVHEPDGAFASLDGLRALAALWVLTFHAVTIPLITPPTLAGARASTRRLCFFVSCSPGAP